jgi:hypothetical protein
LLSTATGVVTTGTDGADAVRNITTNSADATANPSITMGAYASSYNATYVTFGGDTTVPSGPTDFAPLNGTTQATPSSSIMSAFRFGPAATVTTTAAAQDWGGVAVELVAATGATPTSLEWVSPRLTGTAYFDAPDPSAIAVSFNAAIGGTSTLTNARWIMRLYRLRSGVETQFYQYAQTTQIPTTGPSTGGTTLTNAANQTVTPIDLKADDRIVMRFFVAPLSGQTMRTGRVDILYDAGSAVTPGAWLELFDLPATPFKAETDPATPPVVPNGMNLLGLSNGQ